MGKSYVKNLLRDIKKSLSRFLSIVIIIAVGVAFYAGVRATSPDMKKSGDYYFDKNNLMDFKVVSTMGLNEEDISQIKKINGISSAEGSYSIDAVMEQTGKPSLVLNINSLPQNNGINQLNIVSGKMPDNEKEAIVEEKFLQEHKLRLGDKILLKSGKENNIEDSLKNNEFEIVGTAKSPLYISAQRQLSSVGNGSVKGFVYILPEVFKSSVFTEAYVKCDSYESKNSLIENVKYKDNVEEIEKSLKDIGIKRSDERYTEIIKNAEEKINEAEVKLNQAKQYGMTNLGDAEAEIQKSKDTLKEIKKPEWYILGRSYNIGYETYRQDSDRIDNIGKVFPLIFFLVAALVSLTTMTRMVQENRIEIGTFKALGYSNISIVSHYLIYSLAATLIGSLIGVFLGFRVFPSLIINAYSSLYTIPDILTPFNVKLAIQASAIAVLFTSVATVAAVLEELREVAASLMRPKSPKAGSTILLERISFIWKRLSFSKKVTARNIFRYKQRFFMTVIGIAACTGLMITGFGLKDEIIGATKNQFNKIYKYDMLTTLSKTLDESQKEAMKEKVITDSNVRSVLFSYTKNGTAEKPDSSSEDAYIVVPEVKEELNNYISLEMDGKTQNLTDTGAVITEKFSKLINKKVGETFKITVNGKVIKIKIAAVTEQYVQHYIYISPEYYREITGEKPIYNGFYGLLKDTSDISQNDTSKTLASIDGINSVSFKNNTFIDFNKSIKSLDSVVLILIISAGVLAFIVIFNLTNININERARELATIKLLGFFNNELAFYIYRENIILTIIGGLTGIILGILMNKFVVAAAETNIMMFLKHINPLYYLYSVIITIVFSIIVNLAMYGRFDRINMIESLKSAE